MPEKGILFPNGTSKDNWQWSVAPLTLIKDEEKAKFPKNQTHKVDLPARKYGFFFKMKRIGYQGKIITYINNFII